MLDFGRDALQCHVRNLTFNCRYRSNRAVTAVSSYRDTTAGTKRSAPRMAPIFSSC